MHTWARKILRAENYIYTERGFSRFFDCEKFMKTSNSFVFQTAMLLLSAAVSFRAINVMAADASLAPSGQTNTLAAPNSPGVQVPLAKFFNLDGIYPDGAEFSDGVDGDGSGCSSNLLGTAQTWNGTKFDIGSVGSSNVVSAEGQMIPLPRGKFSQLKMLAIAVNGAQQSQGFTVIYANTNLNQTFTQNLSDWFSPDNNSGEAQAVTMDYRNQSDGTKDDRQFYIYGYSFSLSATNATTGLKLPDNDDVKVVALTLLP